MSEVPDELRYTAEHEWVRTQEGARVRIGVTDFAQSALGDVVFVSVSEPGTTIRAGSVIGEIESTKSVSDLFAPVDGTVVARNPDLDERPEVVNAQPYGDGWLIEVELSDGADMAGLLDAAAYRQLTES